MKRFLITCTAIIILAIAGAYVVLYTSFTPFSKLDDEPEYFMKVKGKEIFRMAGGKEEVFEIKGVDLGAGIPGAFATEFAIDYDMYLEWFKLIQEMNANVIRVYTISDPEFYHAFYDYNADNPNPLYLLHGVWVDDEVVRGANDAYADQFIHVFYKDCEKLVDVLHGRRNIWYNSRHGYGAYKWDVSQWVAGYILGVEWDPDVVLYTDDIREYMASFEGEFLYTDGNASAFEAMLARVGDRLLTYEMRKYGEQKLLAFSNWPETDPLDHEQWRLEQNTNLAKIDVEHIHAKDKLKTGMFASYHIYPYYPAFLDFEEKYAGYVDEKGENNPYQGYLKEINRHHTVPVVVSEFGLPSSRGIARINKARGMDQGNLSEEEQAKRLKILYKDIKTAGCAGAVVFAWQDEWFKRTWNTMANVDLSKTAYWSDFQTNEQFFGLMAFDPGKETSVCYTDGDVDEWSEKDLIADYGSSRLYMKYDEKFIYFRIHQEHPNPKEILYIPVDVTPKTGSYYAKKEELKFDRQADFLIVLDGEDNSKVLVQERYEAFRVIFAEDYGEENPYFNVPDKDSPLFVNIYMALQLGKINAVQEEDKMAERFETGRLTFGNGNPYSEDYNSVSDFIVKGNEIEIRLPWQLLNFSNPAEQQVHDDYYENYGIENLKIDSIYAGLGSSEDKGTRIRMGEMPLVGWGKNPEYHERLKQSYYAVKEIWAKNAG